MKNLFHKKTMSVGQRNKKRAGVCMVETVISVAIFATFMTAASKIIVMNRQLTDMARAHYTAANIAKNRMELVRTFGFDQVDNFLEDNVRIDASGQPDLTGKYRRSTTIAPQKGNLIELTITVEIQDRKTLRFKGRKEALETYFAQYLTEESSVGAG